MADMIQLLQAMLSPVPTVQKPAEAQYDELKKQPEVLVPGLVGAVQSPQADEATKQMAAVLLRRLLQWSATDGADGGVYGQLQPQTAAALRAALLQLAYADGQPKAQRRALAGAVSALGARLLDDNEWPELLPAIQAALASGPAAAQCSALEVLGELMTHNADDGMKAHMPAAVDMLGKALASQAAEVRKAAATAALTMAQELEPELVKPCSVLVAPVMEVLAAMLQGGDSDGGQELLIALTETADANIKLFTKSGILPQIVEAMLKLASTEGAEEDCRRQAAEFLISVCEEDPKAAKKIQGLAERFVPMLMNWLVLVPEGDGQWGQTEEEDDDGDMTMYDTAAEGLDRIAIALGGKALAGLVLADVHKYLANQQDWRYRYIALFALSQTAEGCAAQYKPQLEGMAKMALERMEDPHPRVRHQATATIAQFCTDLSPEFQQRCTDGIIPAMLKAFQDPVPRVRFTAIQGIVNFTDDTEEATYAHQVEPVLSALHVALNRPDEQPWIKEMVVDVVATLAGTAPETFKKFYASFMPIVKAVFALPEEKQYFKLKGKAINCAGAMALSAGKEVFAADSEAVMGYMHGLTQRSAQDQLESDDPRLEYLIKAWRGMAQCIGEHFEPYIDAVLPFALRLAAQQSEAAVLDEGDPEPQEEGVECIRLAMPGGGEKRLAIKTAIIEEKYFALQIVKALLDALGHVMAPRAPAILTVLLSKDVLTNGYDEDIQQIAADICPLVVKSVVAREEKQLLPAGTAKQMLAGMVPTLIEAIRDEEDAATAAEMLKGLYQSVSAAGADSISAEHVALVANTALEMFNESLKRCKKLDKKRAAQGDDDDDDDDGELGVQTVDEETLLLETTEVIATLVKTQAAAFMPDFVARFLPLIVQMIAPSKTSRDHRFGLFMLVDFTIHGGDHVARMFNDIVQAMMMYAPDRHAEVVRAAAWGLGACAQWAAAAPGRAFAPGRGPAEIVTVLKQIIAGAPAGEEDRDEWAAALCNAASSLLKVLNTCKGQPGVTDEAVLPVIFPLLPLYGDDEEARSVHRQVFEMVTQGHPAVVAVGQGPIIRVAQQLLAKEKEEEEELLDDATRRVVDAMLAAAPATMP